MAVVSNYISMNTPCFLSSFKQYTGGNFVNYLKEIRMREAKKLLTETDMKIIEISQAVGYDNEKHFMKNFLKQPVEYLRQNTVTMLIYPNPDEKSVFAGTYVHLPWKIKL